MDDSESKNFLSFIKWRDRYDLSEGLARKLLFFRKSNGLSRAVIRIGRKLLIDDSQFRKWIEKYREDISPIKDSKNKAAKWRIKTRRI